MRLRALKKAVVKLGQPARLRLRFNPRFHIAGMHSAHRAFEFDRRGFPFPVGTQKRFERQSRTMRVSGIGMARAAIVRWPCRKFWGHAGMLASCMPARAARA